MVKYDAMRAPPAIAVRPHLRSFTLIRPHPGTRHDGHVRPPLRRLGVATSAAFLPSLRSSVFDPSYPNQASTFRIVLCRDEIYETIL
jgi:hypothetical protein